MKRKLKIVTISLTKADLQKLDYIKQVVIKDDSKGYTKSVRSMIEVVYDIVTKKEMEVEK